MVFNPFETKPFEKFMRSLQGKVEKYQIHYLLDFCSSSNLSLILKLWIIDFSNGLLMLLQRLYLKTSKSINIVVTRSLLYSCTTMVDAYTRISLVSRTLVLKRMESLDVSCFSVMSSYNKIITNLHACMQREIVL